MYRVEIFNMFSASYVDAFMLDKQAEIVRDYINPVTFEIDAPVNINADLKNTVVINDGTIRVFIGTILNIERQQYKTILTLGDLASLVNVDSMQNVTNASDPNYNWGQQIYYQLWYDFMQSNPSLYKMPLVYTSAYPYSNWAGYKPTYYAEIKNDRDCIIDARQTYGLFMRWRIGTSGTYLGKPYFGFLDPNVTPKVIEADLDNILSKEIIETTDGGYNIAILWLPDQNNPDNYLRYTGVLYNGTVYYDRTHRDDVTDPRITEKVIDKYTLTTDELHQEIDSMIKPSSDNLTIRLRVMVDDKLINPRSTAMMRLGTPVTILSGGRQYNTYLTGYRLMGDVEEMTFGMVRQTLTAKLFGERKG